MSKKPKSILPKAQLALAVVALGALQSPASAADATGNLTALATLIAQCFIGDATMDFGSVSAFAGGPNPSAVSATTNSASTSISILCTYGSTANVYAASSTVTLSAGGSATPTMPVNLLTSAGGTAYPTTSGTGVAITGAGTLTTTPIAGTLVVPASATPGTYIGTVALTISY